MTEPAALRATCRAAVAAAGLTAVGELFHRFEPGRAPTARAPAGITGVVLLAESHLAVHTWPELEAATLDVYVCNLGARQLGARRGAARARWSRRSRRPASNAHARVAARMKAIVLAAGRGERMRPLSDSLPEAAARACTASR